MTKFKVGDKVRIISLESDLATAVGAKVGEIVEVASVSDYVGRNIRCKYSKSNTHGHGIFSPDALEKLSDTTTKNQRITTLEQNVVSLESEVAELKAKVEALEKAQKQSLVYEGSAQFINGERVIKVAPTYNEQRKAIIAEAKTFVAKLTQPKNGVLSPLTQRVGSVRIKFEVNAEKRTVVALGKLAHVPDKYGRYKAIAKCAPDDVFNADIGKAIALGRALGLDVSRFEQAVKPTEVVVGQVVEDLHGPFANGKVNAVKPRGYSSADKGYTVEGGGWGYLSKTQITDDTEAKY